MISIEKKPLHKQLDAFLGITIRFEYCRCFFFFFFCYPPPIRRSMKKSASELHTRSSPTCALWVHSKEEVQEEEEEEDICC